MNNRRIALGLGTGAGALLGAALLSGLAIPVAAADTFSIEPIPVPVGDVGVTNPETVATLPAFGGLGTDTISEEFLGNYDVPTTGTAFLATGDNFGEEELLTNVYSNPLFTDTSTDVTQAIGSTGAPDTGALAGNLGVETDTLLFDPSSGLDFGISLESVPGVSSDAAPTVTEDLITPLGNFPISDLLGGSDLTSLLGSGDGLGSLLTGGDLLTGLDPFVSLLTSF
jgi:hypothetical protein